MALGHVERWQPHPWEQGIVPAALLLAVLAGPLVAFTGIYGVVGAVVLMTFAAMVAAPQLGAYTYLFATPLIVGFERGSVIPLIRPNEALLAILLAAAVTHAMIQLLKGERWWPAVDRLDGAIVALAALGSIFPLLQRYGRGLPITTDDVLYAIVLWKYYLIFRIFRATVTTAAQVRICLWLSMAAAAIVATIALLQVSELLRVPELLETYYELPFGGRQEEATVDRGTATMSSSFGVAAVMTMNLAIALAWLLGGQRRRGLLTAAAALFVLGCIAAGQFSGLIGLGITVLVVGHLTGNLGRVLAMVIPAGAASALLVWPVILERIRGFDSPYGLPPSWVGRYENLQNFVWPELITGVNWLVGVRPSTRLVAPEGWRDWIWIESGYAWLLWSGGLPMLVAFFCFVWIGCRKLRPVAHARGHPASAAATAAYAWLVAMVFLMLLDPHITMRGEADLLYPLLAMAMVGASRGDARQ